MPNDRWHSSVLVSIALPSGTRLRDLREHLLSDGYTQVDDVLKIRRPDSVAAWQTETLVGVFVHNGERELGFYPPYADSCTQVTLQYLLPWLPQGSADAFVAAAVRLSTLFGAPMLYAGVPIASDELKAEIARLSTDLARRVDAPGSEFLAIAISEDLPL